MTRKSPPGKPGSSAPELTAFAETLIQEGRLLPRDQAGLVEFATAIPADQVIEFADGDQVVKPNVNAWLRTSSSACRSRSISASGRPALASFFLFPAWNRKSGVCRQHGFASGVRHRGTLSGLQAIRG